jgi:serine/threonine protein kinase
MEMHSKNIIHRDIKPDNVLIKSSKKVDLGRKVCLADFGIACLVDDEEQTSKLCGTPGFIDPFMLNIPEVMVPSMPPIRATLKSDIFSVGSVFYGLLAGKPLIEGNDI